MARRIGTTDVAYALVRDHFVAATVALVDWDDDGAEWVEDTSGWFTIYRSCELVGEFELTGRFAGTEPGPAEPGSTSWSSASLTGST